MAVKKETAAPVPTVGADVLAFGVPKGQNNGADYAPAVVTRVFESAYVNARVFCDGHEVLWWTSVPVFESPDALEQAHEEWLTNSTNGGDWRAVCWPAKD